MRIILFLLLAGGLLLMPLAGMPGEETVKNGQVEKAVAVLHPSAGNSARGVVTFTREKDGIRIVAEVEGITEGQHGYRP